MGGLYNLFTDYSSLQNNLGLLMGVVDMDNVYNDPDAETQYYLAGDFVRVRIPSIHGLPKALEEKVVGEGGSELVRSEKLRKLRSLRSSLTDLRKSTPSSELPWARIIVPLQAKATSINSLTGNGLRHYLNLDVGNPIVYMISLGGDLSQLVVIGKTLSSCLLEEGATSSGSYTPTGSTGATSSYSGVITEPASSDFMYPVNGPNSTSDFGNYVPEVESSNGDYHVGTDLVSTKGDLTIGTIADGTVVVSTENSWFGNHVIVEHSFTGKNKTTYYYYTVYCHLSNRTVNTGDSVKKGKQVGVMGNTGMSFGVHLHAGLITNLDPKEKLTGFSHAHGYGPTSGLESGYITYDSLIYYDIIRVCQGGLSSLEELILSATQS